LLKIGFSTEAASRHLAIAAPSGSAEALLAGLDQHDFKSEPEQLLPLLTEHGWRVLVGLGDSDKLDAASLRRIGGTLFAELAGLGLSHLSLDLGLPPAQLAELAYGAALRAWRPAARYRQTPDPEKIWHLVELTFVTDAPDKAELHYRRHSRLVEAVHFARDLAVAPGNLLTPPAFLAELAKIPGVTLEVIDPAKAGLNLLQAVGQGSIHPPALAVLRWRGPAANSAPIALVGKGITFDSGGIDIKPAKHMAAMKGDMAGAAAVAGTLMALAAQDAPVDVLGVLAIAENMPSGRAMRPGDVVRSYQGQTVEIIDTDAEGRLVLADALAYVAKHFKPSHIIDLATLTGAVEVTLGYHRAGLFCADDGFADLLFAAGEAEDEKLWRLPLTDRYDEAIRSDIADLRNCTWDNGPDALHAARFLQHFVPDGVIWAHLDIAGLSEADEDGPLAAEGPSGFGVRLLDLVIRDLHEAGR
jgi:leucyl aminopeptidase